MFWKEPMFCFPLHFDTQCRAREESDKRWTFWRERKRGKDISVLGNFVFGRVSSLPNFTYSYSPRLILHTQSVTSWKDNPFSLHHGTRQGKRNILNYSVGFYRKTCSDYTGTDRGRSGKSCGFLQRVSVRLFRDYCRFSDPSYFRPNFMNNKSIELLNFTKLNAIDILR